MLTTSFPGSSLTRPQERTWERGWNLIIIIIIIITIIIRGINLIHVSEYLAYKLTGDTTKTNTEIITG